MARIRSIKPEIWTDPDFCDLSLAARLFFIGTFNFADDWGLLIDDPRRLKLQIFPADDIDPHGLVDELIEARFLERLTAPDGSEVLLVRTFTVHQKIDKRAAGRWGNPATWGQSPPIPTNPHHPRPCPSLEGNGREGISNGAEGDGAAAPRHSNGPAAPGDTYEQDFELVWSEYPRRTERKAALKAYQARRREGADHDELLAATKHYATASTGTEQRYIKRGSTFYGPNEVWRDWVHGNPEPQTPPGGTPRTTAAANGWYLHDHDDEEHASA